MRQATESWKRRACARTILLATALALSASLLSAAQAADSARPASSEQSAGNSQPIGDAKAGGSEQSTNGAAVLEAFDQQQVQRVKQASELNDHNKRMIMFALAVPLFILLLTTAGLGIATGVYGKKLFIPHMIFAGLSVTLALAHAIVGIVWFYPF